MNPMDGLLPRSTRGHLETTDPEGLYVVCDADGVVTSIEHDIYDLATGDIIKGPSRLVLMARVCKLGAPQPAGVERTFVREDGRLVVYGREILTDTFILVTQ